MTGGWLTKNARALIGLLAALAGFLLGYAGFATFLPTSTIQAGTKTTDLVYYTLQLFLLDAAPLQTATNLPVTLEIARFLAPASTAFGLVVGAWTVYRSTYHAVRSRQLHDHTVVLGQGAQARLIARAVVAEGASCAVVGTEAMTVAGAVAVEGDPSDPAVLREARIDAAREVMIVSGESTRNVDIAASVREALDGGSHAPACFLEMRSPEFAVALAAHELTSPSAVHLEFFDPTTRAVRRLFDRHLTALRGDVVLIGSGETYDAARTELGRRCERPGRDMKPSYLTPSEVRSIVPSEGLHLVVVVVDGDESAVALGLRVLRQVRGRPVGVVVATHSSTALGARITPQDVAASGYGGAELHLFNVAEEAYALAALRRGLYEELARAAHESYVEQARARGETTHTNPSTVSWSHLDEDLRTENLAQAHAFGRYLRTLPAVVVPDDGHGEEFAFAGGEVERRAEDEHVRWRKSKEARGWKTGARNDVEKKHPDLVDWSDLDETARQKDRDAVLAIPGHLSRIGLRVVRVAPGDQPAANS
ncbi:RyR domain-containing protein [Actinomycetospora sp. NBRC 106378]|uniref:RyR domain-containing protein n=1 Tax=Actinomycetospora sp. NBRC 106378 TaxID=3032208 RepID=UPI0024A39C2A|nr:RyR domain-containing protein [Actinomycetospora sp. NBRC 106378]GLZ51659.1 hypothetical protein Acsp07_12760 [Actinomycetospora sp. NBRC 106378]